MVGAGIVTLLLSIVLFGTLPQSFFPPQNDDYSRVNITLPPGSTLKQTEAATDRVAAIVSKDPNVERVFERVNVGTGPGEHRAQEGPQGHQHRVRARARRRRWPRSPTPASASRARTAAAPTRTRATSCSSWAATIRCS